VFTKIFIDMDGVLADFDRWRAEVKDIYPEAVNDETLWDAVKEVDHFYLKLKPCKDALALMDFLRSLHAPLCILTALPRRATVPQAESDKREWVKKFIDPHLEFKIGPFSRDKHEHCIPGSLLIDDNQRNVEQWQQKGGYAIFYQGLEQTQEEILDLLDQEV
jgi:5'(3')-deoxyribonucleotidase